jgi:hypothetical protein
MCIIHIVEATYNQSLKIGVAWKIKQLSKIHKGIIHEFQFVHPKSTCISAIIFKTVYLDIINITKMYAVLKGIDAAKAFDLVVNQVALLVLRSLDFPKLLTTTIGKLWSGRRFHVKTAYGVSAESYRSTLTELLFGIRQGSMASTYIFGFCMD